MIVTPIAPKTNNTTGPSKCFSWDLNINIPKAFTNPIITGFGINLIRLPNLKYPSIICIAPARMVAANKYSIP